MKFNRRVLLGSSTPLFRYTPPPIQQAYDIHRFLTVTDQVTTSSTFEVQLITSVVDPNVIEVAPTVTVNGTNDVVASLVDLKFPGSDGLPTTETSTQVYQATVTLADGNNMITIKGTTTSIYVKKKVSLSSVTVENRGEFQTELVNACHGADIDEIILNYPESDLPEAMNGAGVSKAAVENSGRNSWITIRPGTGSVSWPRSSTGSNLSSLRDQGEGATLFRPNCNYICFDSVTIGAPDDDQTVAGLSTEVGFCYWLKNCTETFKYNYNYTSTRATTPEVPGVPYPPHDNDATAIGTEALIDYQNPPTTTIANSTAASGVRVYQTGCVVEGTAAQVGGREICLNNYYDQIRYDPNNNSRVFVNCYINSCTIISTVRTSGGTPVGYDTTHLDLLQFWGAPDPEAPIDEAYTNLVACGLKAANNGTLPTNLQICIFDRTYDTERTNVLIRDISTEVPEMTPPAVNNFFQFAGYFTNVRLENISMASNGYFTFRRNFTDTGFTPAQFTPTNVYIKNTSVNNYIFGYPDGIGDANYSWETVSNPNDVVVELNNEAAGQPEYANNLIFISPCSVAPAPPYITLGNYENPSSGSLAYRCSVVPPDQLIYPDMTNSSFSYTLYPSTRITNPYIDGGLILSFLSDTAATSAENMAIAAGSTYRLTVTLGVSPSNGTQGDTLVYETTTAVTAENLSDTFVTPTSSNALRYIPADQWTLQANSSGYVSNFLDEVEHWGNNPRLVVTIL